MESKGQLAQVIKLSGKRCGRSGSDGAFQIVVGKETKECSYRTPVLGRDLEIAATATLLSKTPKPVQRSAYLGVDLRAGGGARYQLAVFPLQRKAQVRKVLADGTIEYLDIEKNVAGIGGADKANQLRLRAFNVTSGDERDLAGRASGFSVGSTKNAKGAQASVDDVVVRVPSPF
jgi:hypothetical protein